MTAVESIKVVIRFRPFNSVENTWAIKNKIDISNYVVQISQPDCKCVEIFSKDGLVAKKKFFFDYIFDHDTPQKKFFDIGAAPVVENLFTGFNATIFAYGQTGSGKTWSMMGPSYGARLSNPELRGVIPRSIDFIFEKISNSAQNLEYKLSVSYLEIYKERIKDLLFPKNNNLPIHGTPKTGIYIKGLSEVFVGNREEILGIITKGDYNRTMAKTDMNAHSSRSHSVFILNVEAKNTAEGSTTNAKLNLVDLAGSEKVGKTNVTGAQLEEAKKINQSLSALGHCINSIVKRKKHIPFRDSKLTRILEESIGGHAKCSIICAASKHFFNKDETISTLGFGKRAKSIQVRVKQNKVLSADQLMKIVEQLKKKLLIARKKNKALLLTIKELRALTPAEEKELGTLKKVKVDKNLIGKSEDEAAKAESGGAAAPAESGGGGEEESEGEGEDVDFSNVEDDSRGQSELVTPASYAEDPSIVNLPLEALRAELTRIKVESENEKQHFEETLENEKQDNKTLSIKVGELEKTLGGLKDQNSELLNEKEMMDSIKKDMQEKFDFEREISENKTKQYEDENTDLLKKVSELEEINQELSGKVEIMEGTSIKDPAKRGEFQSQLEKYRREFKELKTENEYLMEMVEKKNEKVDELHREVMDQENISKQEGLKFEKLNKFKDSLIEQLEAFEKDIDEAEKNVMTLASENEKFEVEAQKVRQESAVLYRQMQEKNLILKKMRILCQRNGVDVLEIRDIKLDQLLEEEKKRVEEVQLADGEMDESALAQRLLMEDEQFNQLQKFETTELSELETMVYGEPQTITSQDGYVQKQDGTFQRTSDGVVLPPEQMTQESDGSVRGPDGMMVVAFENEDGSVQYLQGEQTGMEMPQGWVQLADGTFQSTVSGGVVQKEEMVTGEDGQISGSDGLKVVGMQALAGNVVFCQEGGSGAGGLEQFDQAQPGYVQKQDGTFESIKDGAILKAEEMKAEEGGFYTGPDGGYVLGMEAPAGGIVNLMDPNSSMGGQNGGEQGVGMADTGMAQDGYIQLQDGTFQSSSDGAIYAPEQMQQGPSGEVSGPDGRPLIAYQATDGSVVPVDAMQGGDTQQYAPEGQQQAIPQGYIQLQDGTFQSSISGEITTGEQMVKGETGAITGPEGLAVVAMQTVTGAVVNIDNSGGMEQFNTEQGGYIQLQDGSFQSIKSGDVVDLQGMTPVEGGLVGPDETALVGMQTPYGTIINLAQQQGAQGGYSQGTGGVVQQGTGGATFNNQGVVQAGTYSEFSGQQGSGGQVQQGGGAAVAQTGGTVVQQGGTGGDRPPPKLGKAMTLPTIKVSGKEIEKKRKKGKIGKPSFTLPKVKEVVEEGHPRPPRAPMTTSINTDLQEQLLSEVEKNRSLETENRSMKNELRELKFELEQKDSDLIEKEVTIRTETVQKGFELTKIRVKELEERLQEKDEQYNKYRKKKEETIAELEEEKKTLIGEREKYIQETVKGGGGRRGGRGGGGGGIKNIVDNFFALRLKSKKMEDDLAFYRKNYGMQRKQNSTDRRKMKNQDEVVIRTTKRVKELEQQLDIARNRYTQRKEVVEEFNREKKRMTQKIDQLKTKIDFLKELQEAKKEIDNTGTMSSGSISSMSGLGSGKLVKVLRGGGKTPTPTLRGGGGKKIIGGGKTIRGGAKTPIRPSRPRGRGRGRRGRGRF